MSNCQRIISNQVASSFPFSFSDFSIDFVIFTVMALVLTNSPFKPLGFFFLTVTFVLVRFCITSFNMNKTSRKPHRRIFEEAFDLFKILFSFELHKSLIMWSQFFREKFRNVMNSHTVDFTFNHYGKVSV